VGGKLERANDGMQTTKGTRGTVISSPEKGGNFFVKGSEPTKKRQKEERAHRQRGGSGEGAARRQRASEKQTSRE